MTFAIKVPEVLTIDRLRYLAQGLGFHVFTIGEYPDGRVALVLSPHPIPGRQESAILDLMCEIEDERPCGIQITVDV